MLKRAPYSLTGQLETLPGAAHVQTSLIHDVPIDLPEVPDPIIGRLIGLDLREPLRLNKVYVRSGRMIQAHQSGAMEALVSEGFAVSRGLKLGDRVRALVNGKREPLLIVGIATSPEYIFAGLAGSPDQRGFGILWVDHAALAAAYNEEGAFNSVAVRLAPQASEGAVIDGLNRLLGPYGGVNAHGRDRQMSHMILDSEIKEQRVLGTVLPSIFLAVAGFLLGELAIEIAFAIPLGLVLGYGLALTIINLIKTDEFFFPLIIEPRTYAFAALSVVVAGLVSALIVRRRIDRLDLVAVLKTRE